MPKNNLTKILVSLILLILVSSLVSADLTYDSTNNTIQIRYDHLNRISVKSTNTTNITYGYDAQLDGTLTNITTTNLTTKYEYDNKKRITKETRIIDNIQFTKTFSYDSSNRPIQRVITNNDLEYLYNKQGKVSKILSNTAPYYLKSSQYNAFGSVTQREYGNNLLTNFTYYTANNRISGIKTASSQNLAYEYDNVGNILAIRDLANRKNLTMGYDQLDRLINTTIDLDIYRYSYDSIGNIKRIVRGANNSSKVLVYQGNIPHAPSMIIDGIAGAGAYSPTDLDTDSKNRTIEFILFNEKAENLSNVNWSINFGNNIVNSNIPLNLSTEEITVIVQNNYSDAGAYEINISTNADQNIFTDKFGIKADSIGVISRNITASLFEFQIENDIAEQARNVGWECSEGITSTRQFNISGNDIATVIIAYNYSSSGEKQFICSANSTDGTGNKTTDFTIKGLAVENYDSHNTNTNQKIVVFNAKNYYYLLESNISIISETEFSRLVNLSTKQSIMVIAELNYSDDGDKTVNVSFTSGNITGKYSEAFKITALLIDRYFDFLNGTRRFILFDVLNKWPANLSVTWNVTEPLVINTTNLIQNETISVIIAENYTTQGTRESEVNAYTTNFSVSQKDKFTIKLIQLLNFQILKESLLSTIFELIPQSNYANNSVNWSISTGEVDISANRTIQLNESEFAIVIVEEDYSSAGIYQANASINSSDRNDFEKGTVVISP